MQLFRSVEVARARRVLERPHLRHALGAGQSRFAPAQRLGRVARLDEAPDTQRERGAPRGRRRHIGDLELLRRRQVVGLAGVGEHDDGNGLDARGLPDQRAEPRTVRLGEGRVEDEEVRAESLERLQREMSALGLDHRQAGLLQLGAQRGTHGAVTVCDEDRAGPLVASHRRALVGGG